jgi:hypothetical protein
LPLCVLKEAVHKQTKRRAVQPIGVHPAEQVPSRTRPATPHPGVSVKSRNAIGHALFHGGISVFSYQLSVFSFSFGAGCEILTDD